MPLICSLALQAPQGAIVAAALHVLVHAPRGSGALCDAAVLGAAPDTLADIATAAKVGAEASNCQIREHCVARNTLLHLLLLPVSIASI
jgi:hypothetical protein